MALRATRTTRSKGGAATTTADPTASAPASSQYALAPESTNPPSLFILPKQATPASRIVTLPHPRYAAKPTRYLVCPDAGVYEFTRIAPPTATPRSWLLTGVDVDVAAGAAETVAETVAETKANEAKEEPEANAEPATSTATATATDVEPTSDPATADDAQRFVPQVSMSADLFVATVVDPLFLLLPALAASSSSSSSSSSPSSSTTPPKRMFLTADDHFDALPQDGSDLAALLRQHPAVRERFAARLAAVCDTVAAGDEPMFRLNEDKLLLALVAKAQRMSGRLPASMDAQFVRPALAAPVLSVRSSQAVVTGRGNDDKQDEKIANTGASTPLSSSSDSAAESQSSVSSAASSVPSTASAASDASSASTAATDLSAATDDNDDPAASEVRTAMQASDDVVALQQLRVAFAFLCERYVPPALAASLTRRLGDGSGAGGIDFALDYVRKRGLGGGDGDDDEEDDDRREKRRKLEEEEKRKKAGISRGVRDLKKVNVSGMKKLSDFFKKK
ncbi:Ribonuclease H2, subunit B [Niveomyces insectorum RCEF 264]|uniref:Ribonuclease H2 subunit B n=1 Tax=Niveomyces insectorum RCEF 264 TaxID=1081102 RepID=A0A167VMZ4_9HYPO|nr:Ribonuclease H2, subunit B [Niveomyces insectorum RCEF 264]